MLQSHKSISAGANNYTSYFQLYYGYYYTNSQI